MKKYFSLSALAMALIATPLYSSADDSSTLRTFATIPLRLNNKIDITSNGVKPNVMFLIDDSGSMKFPVEPASKICNNANITDDDVTFYKLYDGTWEVYCPDPNNTIVTPTNLPNPPAGCDYYRNPSQTTTSRPVRIPSSRTINRYFGQVTSSIRRYYRRTFRRDPTQDEINQELIKLSKTDQDYPYILCVKNIPTLKTKIDITAEAMRNIIQKYNSKMYFGISTINDYMPDNPDNPSQNMRKNYLTDRQVPYTGFEDIIPKSSSRHYGHFTSDFQILDSAIDKITPFGFTPSTTAYLRTAKSAVNDLRYRCQRSFIVMMSDGDPTNENYRWGPSVGKQDIGSLYIPKEVDELNEGANTSGYNKNKVGYSNNEQITGSYDNFATYYGEVARTTTPVADLATANQTGNSYENSYMYDYAGKTGINGGIAHFSHILNTKDFKNQGNDEAGKSWDDPLFKNQTLQTYTVGFGAGISPEGKQYLSNAATSGGGIYLSAKNEQELNSAFTKIFDDIQTKKSNYKAVQSYSSVAPTILSKPEGLKDSASIDMAMATYLDSGTWSSQLRFFKTDKFGAVTTNEYFTPDFSHRKAIIDFGDDGVYDASQIIDSYNPYNSIHLSRNINNTYFNVPQQNKSGAKNNEWSQALIPWVTRLKYSDDPAINQIITQNQYWDQNAKDHLYRIRPVNSKTNPPSARDMGDVLDTPVVALGDYLVTAANDGMVYLFEKNKTGIEPSNLAPLPEGEATKDTTKPAKTNYHPYKLVLNYIPANMPNTQGGKIAQIFTEQANPDYGIGKAHIYGINGGLVLRQAPENGNVFTVGTLGQGGRGMYALNVSAIDDPKFKDKVPLINFTDDELGFVTGSPQIGFISLGRDDLGQVQCYQQTSAIPTGSRSANDERAGKRKKPKRRPGGGKKPPKPAQPNVPSTTPQIPPNTGNPNVPGNNQPTSSSGNDCNGKNGVERVIFLGNGYNHDGRPTLYIIGMPDPSSPNTNGQVIAQLTASNSQGGLSQPALIDTDGDGVVDLAYAGDTNGNMYRFDLRGNPNTWQKHVTQIFHGSPANPITITPVVARIDTDYYSKNNLDMSLKNLPKAYGGLPVKTIRYSVVFGTGSDLYDQDAFNTSKQYVYGIFDYIRNPATDSGGAVNRTLRQSDLLAQSWTCPPDSKGRVVCNLSNNKFTDESHKPNPTLLDKADYEKGWYYPLNPDNHSAGERVVVRPVLLQQTAFLTTRIYTQEQESENTDHSDPCVNTVSKTSTGAKSRFIQFNVRNGGITSQYGYKKGFSVKDVYVPLGGSDEKPFSSMLYDSLFIPQYFTTSLNPYKNRMPKECLLPQDKINAKGLAQMCNELKKKLTCISGKTPTDVGGNGQECLPIKMINTLDPAVSCFDKGSANSHYLTGVKTKTGIIKPYTILGGVCPNTDIPVFNMKRVSWRELF